MAITRYIRLFLNFVMDVLGRKRMKLAIIVGHYPKVKGAHITSPINMYEYDWNDLFSIDVYREAREAGLDARVFKRPDGMTRRQIGRAVDEFCGDDGIAVELHINAFDRKVKGTETLYDDDPQDNENFARTMHRHLVAAFDRSGKADRGIRLVDDGMRGHTNLDSVHCTSCIVEPVFGDNPSEARLLYKTKYAYARAIVAAVLEWIERR